VRLMCHTLLLSARCGQSCEGRNLADTQIYRHPKRPEWGMAVFNDEMGDRMRFAFDDDQIRAFRTDSLHVLEIVNLPEAEAAKVRAQLGRKRSITAAGLPKKKGKARVKAAKAPTADAKAPTADAKASTADAKAPTADAKAPAADAKAPNAAGKARVKAAKAPNAAAKASTAAAKASTAAAKASTAAAKT
jgi:hypothetical protein